MTLQGERDINKALPFVLGFWTVVACQRHTSRPAR